MAVIMIFPVCYAVYYSFFSMKLGGIAKFVAFKNYTDILTDREFLEALRFSLLYTVVTVTFQVVLGMVVALLMDNITKWRKPISVLIYLPYFISASVSGIIFRWLFISNWGLVAQFLGQLGIPAPSWFDSPALSKVIVMAAEIWQNTPFAVIIFYAGLQSVSLEQLEAAKLDGAGSFRQFWSITLPMISPTIFYLIITRTMAVFKIFGSVSVFTMGTAINSNRSVVLEIYTTAFSKYEFGPASAMSMVLFAIIMVVTGINFVGQKKWVHY